MSKVAVLMGGLSREREISFRSGRNICQALRNNGHQVNEVVIDSPDFTKQLQDSEVVFIALHGFFGEDGQVQKILEDIKMPYTGSGPQSSADCMNKVITKKILRQNNLSTPDFEVVNQLSQITLPTPLVLKATSEGSSYGIFICHNQQEVQENFKIIKKDFPEFFVEKYIKGPEVTVGVIKNKNEITVYPLLELIPKNEFCDYQSKYTAGMTEFIIPARLSVAVSEQIKQQSIKAFEALRCDGAIRIDFIVENGEIAYITEINTIPGMTDQSDLPAVAKANNVSFEQLVELILANASLGKY